MSDEVVKRITTSIHIPLCAGYAASENDQREFERGGVRWIEESRASVGGKGYREAQPERNLLTDDLKLG